MRSIKSSCSVGLSRDCGDLARLRPSAPQSIVACFLEARRARRWTWICLGSTVAPRRCWVWHRLKDCPQATLFLDASQCVWLGRHSIENQGTARNAITCLISPLNFLIGDIWSLCTGHPGSIPLAGPSPSACSVNEDQYLPGFQDLTTSLTAVQFIPGIVHHEI